MTQELIRVVPALTADQLSNRISAAAVDILLDVRTPEEHSEWAIPNSLNIPVEVLAERLGDLRPTASIVVYCAAGTRSARAAALLADAGFEVADLCGGITAWFGSYAISSCRRGRGWPSSAVGARAACPTSSSSTVRR